jgi:hypothetical protein
MSEIDTLEILVLKRLRDLARMKGEDEFVLGKEVFASMPSIFSISEEDEWTVLQALEEKGLIEVVPSKGIKLKT